MKVPFEDRRFLVVWGYGELGNVRSQEGDYSVEIMPIGFFDGYPRQYRKKIQELRQAGGMQVKDEMGLHMVLRLW